MTNTGTTPLILSGVTSSYPAFTVTPTTATIAAGASITLTVSFLPTTIAGSYFTTLSFSTNAINPPTTGYVVDINVLPSAPPSASVDGYIGSAPGIRLATQTNATGFGDATTPTGTGSELDGVYTRIANGKLYLMLTGNLEPNGNDLEIFFDTKSGGQNVLTATNPDVDAGGLARLAGLRFDAAFAPDYYLTVQHNYSTSTQRFTPRAYYAPLNAAGGSGLTLTSIVEQSAVALDFGSFGLGGLAIDNSNTGGVTGTSAANAGTAIHGVELEIPLAALDFPTSDIKVCAFINGDLHNFVSNQVLAGLPSGTANPGDPSTVNFASYAGDQFFTITNVAAPSIMVTPSPLTLNPTVVATPVTGTLTVTNTGNVPLSISGITSLAPQFTVTPTTATIAAGATTTLTVTFTPTVVGTTTTTLTIASNANNAPTTVSVSGTATPAPAASVDGVLDAGNAYGPAVTVQTTPTGYGDVTPTNAGGSELDAAYARIANNTLYLLLTGNLETNGNRLELFFDTKTGGQQTLLAGNPAIDGNALGQMAGLKFDNGFTSDYYLTVDATSPQVSAYFASTPTSGGGTGTTLVSNSSALTSVPLAFGGALTGQLGFNNTNTGGVTDAAVGTPSAVQTGIELAIPLAALGSPTGNLRIAAFINGGPQHHDYASNQFLAGLPLGTGNLGGDGAGVYTGSLSGVDLTRFAGNQFFTVTNAVTGPAISVTPTPLALGTTVIGTPVTGTLTVTNSGTAALTITGITSSNPRFTVTPVATTVAAGATATLTVTFTPTVTGAQTGTLTIASNATGAPTTLVTVSGTGTTAPTASVDGVLDGGNAYGSAVSVQVNPTAFGDVTPTNDGGSELDAAYARIANGKLYLLLTGNLQANGNDLELFFDTKTGGQNILAAANPTVDNGALAALAGLQFDAAFAPDYYLTVQHTLSGTNPLLAAGYAPLTGAAGTGQLLTSGATGLQQPLDFGSFGAGTLGFNNTNTAGVTDAVVGTPAAVTTGIELEIPLAAIGSPTGAFKVSAFINGALHDFVSNQSLAPLPLGTLNLGTPATVNFAAPANTGDQFFTVTPPTPVATVSTSSLSVGSVAVGSTGSATFTITNTGTAPLVLSGLTSSNPRFTLSPTTGTVAPGATLTITVTFTPTVVGAQTGSVTISSNAAPVTVALNALGTAAPAPILTLSTTTLTIGNVTVGTTGTATFTITNTGNAALTLSGITSSNPRFSAAPTTGTVAAGGSLTVTVTFAPTVVGAQTGTLTLSSNAGAAATVAVSGTGTAVPAPVLTLSTTTVSVGSVTVGATGSATFVISNTGNAPLLLSGITSSSGLFTASPTTGTVVAGGSLTVTVDFTPTAVGPQTGTLTITSNAGASATVTVSGTGTAAPTPVLAVSATSLDLGSITVNTSTTGTFTISNTGTAPLTITGLTSSNSAFTAAPTTGTVAPGASLTITVTFAPTTVGVLTGTLSIASNAAAATVALTGTSTAVPAPVLAVSAPTINVGTVTVGATGTAAAVLTNTGNAPLILTGITSSDPAFTVTPTTGTLAAGSTLTVTITFAPTTVGAQTATLTFTSNAATAPTVTVTGTGTAAPAPVASVSATNVSVGNVIVGATGTATFTLNNTGNVPLTLSSLTSSNAAFAVTPATGTVNAAGALTITVTFTPTTVGAQTATLTLATNDPANPSLTVTVEGTGVAAPTAAITLSSTSASVGSVVVGTTGTATFTITNAGTAPLVISGISSSGPAFSATPTTGTVAPGASLTITVTFAPTTVGVQTGTLVIASNDPVSPSLPVAVDGTGTAAPTGVLTVSATSVTIGPTAIGTTGTGTVTVRNTGTAPLTITALTIGVGGPFSITGTLPATVAPGDSLVLTIEFAPTVVGAQTNTLTIAATGLASVIVDLIGNATITGLPAAALAANLFVYPNPTAVGQTTTVEWTGADALPTSVQILDQLGRLVHQTTILANKLVLDRLGRGVYTLRLHTPAGLVTRRLVVE